MDISVLCFYRYIEYIGKYFGKKKLIGLKLFNTHGNVKKQKKNLITL